MSTSISRTELQSMSKDELVDVVLDIQEQHNNLSAQVSALQKQLVRIRQSIAGAEDEFASWDTESMEPFINRLRTLEDNVGENSEKFEMFVVEDGQTATPDKRALHLRQVLYNRAKSNGGKARLDRDQCESALGGGLHNNTVLDAMKRAVDGSEADIQGSCNLPPVPGVTISVASTPAKQTFIELDCVELSSAELRQNLLTDGRSKGGSE